MTRMVADAQFQADDGGDPPAGPELSTEAIGCGTAMQQPGQTGELLGRQPPRGSSWRPVPEGIGTSVAGPFHPLADGPLADLYGLGDLALRPALLLEVPGLQAPSFLPVVRCIVHAQQSITERPKF
jgi:hypothetical protein